MGGIILEVLKKAGVVADRSTTLASPDGIVLEQIFARPPATPRHWQRTLLHERKTAAHDGLTRPLRVGRHWLIVPVDSGGENPRRITIRIQGGMGFGSGRHETTRLCLRLLENIPAPSSLLDLGTGSGILAIAGTALGTRRVVAIENDPAALRNARANDGLNPTAKRIRWIRADLRRWKNRTRFDVLTANLLSGMLCDEAKRIASWLRPGGHLITSGFFHAQRGEVESALRAAGLRRIRHLRESRWSALLAVKI